MADQESRAGIGSGAGLLGMGEEPPERSSRMPYVAAALAAFLALAALGTSAWLFVDRQSIVEDLRAARTSLREARTELERARRDRDTARDHLREEERRGQRITSVSEACLEALEDSVRLYNSLADELRAVASLDQSRAEELFEQARELRNTANRSLRRCRERAG